MLQRAARTLVVPRWQRLLHTDVTEKSPNEWVTTVDREVEAMVSEELVRLIPGSVVIGEEQCAAVPQWIDKVNDATAWLVDPLDGTVNFIAGRPPVSVMVALLEGGETVASWMLDPLTGTLHRAERGGGAWRNGERVTTPSPEAATPLRGIVKTRFLPEAFKTRASASSTFFEMQPGSNCAGAHYPAVVEGVSDFALYWRTLPWDHAPGALFLTEAGGHVARVDGTAYRPGDSREGLLAARSQRCWELALGWLHP